MWPPWPQRSGRLPSSGTATAREEVFNQIWEIFVRKMKTAAALGVTSVSLVLTGASGATAADSPGVLSNNHVNVPANVLANVCGITANVLGTLTWTSAPNQQPLCTAENLQLLPAPAPAPAGGGGAPVVELPPLPEL